MSEIGAKELQWILSGPAFGRNNQQARQMRGEQKADWMEAFIMANSKNDPTINAATGIKHTVDSIVAELRERVQLDAFTKQASLTPPLAVKASDGDQKAILEVMADYVTRHYLLPERGRTSLPALFEAIKDRFGTKVIVAAGGPDYIKELLAKLKGDHETPNLADGLPTYDGQPLTVRYDGDMRDSSNFLTQDAGSVI